MKRLIPYLLGTVFTISAGSALAQNELAADQNPNFAVSQAKYQKIADSVTEWHSTTIQDTYKAIDYLADREARKAEDRAFRRELRLIRASRNYTNRGYYRHYDPYYRMPHHPGFYYNDFPSSRRPAFRYRNNYPVLPWLIPGIWFR